MNEYINRLKQNGEQITSDIIGDLLTEYSTMHLKQKGLYERYTNETVPIHSRTFDDTNKVNNQINNDFFSEIVDTKTGYFAGNQIVYDYDGEDKEKDLINNFVTLENMADLDSETAKMAAITGMGARLCYIGLDGKPHVMNVNPWECIWVYDRSIDDVQYALRAYEIEDHTGEKVVTKTRIEWYDDKMVYFYVGDQDGYYQDPTEEPKPHMFNGVPLIPFVNNKEWQGDCEKVLDLIDAYDRTISDVNSELESFRLAYMVFKGATIDADTVSKAKQTGAFSLPLEGDAAFLTKNIDDAVIEHHLDRIENNIRMFAKSPNFNDENFGTESGEAKKYKLLSLENKCITTERKFTRALRKQFEIIFSAWNLQGWNFKLENLFFKFTRNLPLDLTYHADVTQKLAGLVSDETRVSLLPFVDDVDYELEKMKEDAYPEDDVNENPSGMGE
jgi:SPP1 family phage portal protein